MDDPAAPASVPPEITSELNNLLHIIAGTTELIGNIWQENPLAEKYLSMLRQSVGRAASVTALLLGDGCPASGKIVVHPAARDRYLAESRWASKQAPLPEPARAPRILVADDEPITRAVAQEVLAQPGYIAVTAQSGFECLSLFAAAPAEFDLVILDFSMPFMDGEETFDRLRTINPAIRVLLHTGAVEPAVAERMLGRGLAGILLKPVPAAVFLATIAEALGKTVTSPADGTAAAS